MPMCFAVTVGCFSAWGGDLVLAGAHMLIVTVLILLRMWKVQEGVVHLILSFAFATIQKSFALVGFATTSVAPPKVIQEARKAGKQRLPAIRTGRHKLQARNVNLLGKEHRPKSIFSRGWDFVSHLPAVFRKLYVPCSFSSLPPKQCEDTVNQTQNGGTKRIRAGVPWSKLRFVCPTRAAKRTRQDDVLANAETSLSQRSKRVSGAARLPRCVSNKTSGNQNQRRMSRLVQNSVLKSMSLCRA